METEKLKILQKIYDKKRLECSKDEIEISILIPIYGIFEEDENIDIINYNGIRIERRSFMNKFNEIYKKIIKQEVRNSSQD